MCMLDVLCVCAPKARVRQCASATECGLMPRTHACAQGMGALRTRGHVCRHLDQACGESHPRALGALAGF
eukprot:2686314-Alexandrium_andersonii.AAC.1